MTRKRFKIFMITFIIISISVLSGFMINNLQNRKKSTPSNEGGDQVQTEGVTGNYNDNGIEEETFSFYRMPSVLQSHSWPYSLHQT